MLTEEHECTRKRRPGPVVAGLLVCLYAGAARSATHLEPFVYEGQGRWFEICADVAARYSTWREAVLSQNRQLGLDRVRFDAWHRVVGEGDVLPALEGQPAEQTVFPAESMVEAGDFSWAGKVCRWVRHDRLQDGVPQELVPRRAGVEPGAACAFFIGRWIHAHDSRSLKMWIAPGANATVSLNGSVVTNVPFSATGPGASDAACVPLPVRQGRNWLVVKFAPCADRLRTYVSFYPQPGDFRMAESEHMLATALLTEHPALTCSFANAVGYDWLACLNESRRADLIQRLRAKFAGAVGEPYAGFRDELSQFSPDTPVGDVLGAFERFAGRVFALNRQGLPPIAFVKRNGYGMGESNAVMFSFRTAAGSAICVFDPSDPESGLKTVFETREGFIWDLSLSYDGKALFMSHKQTTREPFSVWRIGTDGTGLIRVTDGTYHDFNPVEYPDGRIVFSSSRVESFSLCRDYLACGLHVCNADGTNLRRFDFTTLCTVSPSIMPDGSIVCSRWEYQDKNIFSWQGLWTIHPNGRQLKLYYGNTLTVPNSLYGPQAVPGTQELLFTMAAHHFVPIGDIAVVNNRLGVENLNAMRQVTHGTAYRPAKGGNWRETNWGPGDAFFPKAYVDPHPVDDRRFLVSYAGDNGFRHKLFVMDYYGIGEPIVNDPTYDCYSGVSLAPRPRGAVIAGDVPLEPGEGTFFVRDIYQGLEEQGVLRGQVKALRVVRVVPKKWNTEGPRFHDHYPIAGFGSYYIKENLGAVPVAEDGSAFFTAPSNSELYFIALDASGKEVQRMGSVTQITSGESVSCVGCHENRSSAPAAAAASNPVPSREPDRLQPPAWGGGAFDYVKHVQPVFDKYCVSCHSGRNPKGRCDLSGGKTRFFNMSYDELIRRRMVEYYYINQGPTGVFPAMQSGSQISRLTKFIEEKHHDVDMDEESRRRVFAWIDSNVQYYNTWDMSRPYTTGGRDAWYFVPENKRVASQPEAWLAELEAVYNASCLDCHGGISDHGKGWWVNLTQPENSRILNAHLAKEAGGMGLKGKRHDRESPVFGDTDDPHYQALFKAIEKGRDALLARPRMDMPGGEAIAQERNFDRVF